MQLARNHCLLFAKNIIADLASAAAAAAAAAVAVAAAMTARVPAQALRTAHGGFPTTQAIRVFKGLTKGFQRSSHLVGDAWGVPWEAASTDLQRPLGTYSEILRPHFFNSAGFAPPRPHVQLDGHIV